MRNVALFTGMAALAAASPLAQTTKKQVLAVNGTNVSNLPRSGTTQDGNWHIGCDKVNKHDVEKCSYYKGAAASHKARSDDYESTHYHDSESEYKSTTTHHGYKSTTTHHEYKATTTHHEHKPTPYEHPHPEYKPSTTHPVYKPTPYEPPKPSSHSEYKPSTTHPVYQPTTYQPPKYTSQSEYKPAHKPTPSHPKYESEKPEYKHYSEKPSSPPMCNFVDSECVDCNKHPEKCQGCNFLFRCGQKKACTFHSFHEILTLCEEHGEECSRHCSDDEDEYDVPDDCHHPQPYSKDDKDDKYEHPKSDKYDDKDDYKYHTEEEYDDHKENEYEHHHQTDDEYEHEEKPLPNDKDEKEHHANKTNKTFPA